jgi:hypothetical protein
MKATPIVMFEMCHSGRCGYLVYYRGHLSRIELVVLKCRYPHRSSGRIEAGDELSNVSTLGRR